MMGSASAFVVPGYPLLCIFWYFYPCIMAGSVQDRSGWLRESVRACILQFLLRREYMFLAVTVLSALSEYCASQADPWPWPGLAVTGFTDAMGHNAVDVVQNLKASGQVHC
jgi:hypothetical protein